MKSCSIFIIAFVLIQNTGLRISCDNEAKHFSLNGSAVIDFVIQNDQAVEVLLHDAAVLSLKDSSGDEFTAPFNLKTLRPTLADEKQERFPLKAHDQFKLRIDLATLKWGRPTLSPFPRNLLKHSVPAGTYKLCLIVITHQNEKMSLLKSEDSYLIAVKSAGEQVVADDASCSSSVARFAIRKNAF
jgi:hypothetical protein